MHSRWIGAGWKMNKTFAEASAYVQELAAHVTTGGMSCLKVFITPPSTILRQVCDLLRDSPVMVGAQNMHWEADGPFTGEISPLMVKDTGAQLVELGHYERRSQFGDTDFTVNGKVLSALRWGLRPLVCVGEPSIEKEHGSAEEYVARQVRIALHGVSNSDAHRILLAYEPVWAIGVKGSSADPSYANRMHQLIRELLEEQYGPKVAGEVPILYGGSVEEANALPLIEQPQIDGLFVGRAGLNVNRFIDLIDAISGHLEGAAYPMG